MDQTRELVLAAARRILLAEGPDAVTPTRLATLTGISRSTVYRNWPDPKAIVFEAAGADNEQPPFEPSGNVEHDVRAYLEVLRTMLESPRGALLAAQIGRAEQDEDAAEALRTINLQRRAMISQLVKEAVDSFGPSHALLIGPLLFQRLLAREPISDELIALIALAFTESRSDPELRGTESPPR